MSESNGFKEIATNYVIVDNTDEICAEIKCLDQGVANVTIKTPVTPESWTELTSKIAFCIEEVCK